MHRDDEQIEEDVRAPHDRRLSELIDERVALTERLGRDHGDVVELTRRIRSQLADRLSVRALDPSHPDDRRTLAHLAELEPVNPIASVKELERRLAADRRVYVVEHPDLVGRPTNVLWVALCTSLPDLLREILDPDAAEIDPADATVAVYYSIWSVETAFGGIGGGSALVAGAARHIEAEHRAVRTQCTMSPIPGFREWYRTDTGNSSSPRDPGATCARYLTSLSAEGRPIDPVARFHLGNGARLHRVIADADDSELGIARAFGLMANYRYAPEDLAANRDQLRAGVVQTGPQVNELLQEATPIEKAPTDQLY